MNTVPAPPFLTADLAGIGGRIKDSAEDFEVEEMPAYSPCGHGDHLFLWIEKRDMGAEYFVRQVARKLDVAPQAIGAAGIKDRRAVTRQWISAPAAAEPRIPDLEGDGVRVLSVGRHTNKLRPGHLRGNRFRVLVRGAQRKPELVDAILDRIRAQGLPNYYGEQRFGRGGSTLDMGLRLLRGERLPQQPGFFLRKLALSAVQSWLFNECLARRMSDGLMRTVLVGDVLAKWPAGGMFVSEDPGADQPRLNAREVVPAGPIFGRKMFHPPALSVDDGRIARVASQREAAVLQEAGLTIESFAGFGKLALGTRRHNYVYVDDLTAAWEDAGLRMTFTLPAGAYATVLLREVIKSPAAEDESDAEAGE